MDGLPIIDIAGLASGEAGARRAVARDLRAACLAHGFFYCVGHGVPEGLRAAVMDGTQALFDLPDAAKQAIHKRRSACNRGYEDVGGQTLQPGTAPDRKEGFYLGEDLAPDDPRVAAGGFNLGPNQWPDDLPAFRPVMSAYFAAMSVVAARLMRGLALSLDLEEDHFAGFTRDPLCTLRLLHYPPQRPDAEGEMGAGAHTDFGGLTLLMQDDAGGLQVRDPASGGWIAAPAVAGTFVVNLRDMIARWTNDRYRSTLHRVVNAAGRERYSVPFFYSGNPATEVRCLPTCLKAGETPRYHPVTVEAHLRAMYARTYADA